MSEVLSKEIMKEIAEQRKKNIAIHEKYCRFIIEDKTFSEWEGWEKQRIIDLFTGVLKGDEIDSIDANLQFNQGNIKGIFQTHNIDIEKYGVGRYRQ